MAINYSWDVSTCDVYPTKDGKSDVVYKVHWRLKATDDGNNDEDGNPIVEQVYGTIGIDTSDLSSFTAWSNLNSGTVQGWVESALDAQPGVSVAEFKTALNNRIAERINPSSVTKILGE